MNFLTLLKWNKEIGRNSKIEIWKSPFRQDVPPEGKRSGKLFRRSKILNIDKVVVFCPLGIFAGALLRGVVFEQFRDSKLFNLHKIS